VVDIKKLNPDHVAAVVRTANTCPFFTLLSMEIRSLGPGESHLEVGVQEKHFQPYGMVHGGVCASLVDASAFWAVYPLMAEDIGLTTVELKLNYLAPVSEGRLICKGKSIKAGNTICLAEASVEDDKGNLVAHGTSTMMIIPSLKLHGQSQFPPKFLE
jgi:uncharacterized protein (TIGR00369 family)